MVQKGSIKIQYVSTNDQVYDVLIKPPSWVKFEYLHDNQSCIKMTENLVFHYKSKHIEIRFFYIRDMVQKGSIKLQYVSTDEQVANVLTKPLS